MKLGIKKLTFCCQDLYWDPMISFPPSGRGVNSYIYSLFMNLVFPFRLVLYLTNVILQQYVNHELPGVQAGFRKGRGTRDQIANTHWIIKKAREFQKNIYFCFIDYAKAFDYVDHNKLWKILKELRIPDYLTCLLRSLYAGQEATVRTLHGTGSK